MIATITKACGMICVISNAFDHFTSDSLEGNKKERRRELKSYLRHRCSQQLLEISITIHWSGDRIGLIFCPIFRPMSFLHKEVHKWSKSSWPLSFQHKDMNKAVIFLIIELHRSVCEVFECPSPYKNILDVCLHFPNTTLSWCHAQQYCSSIGGELVRGNRFLTLHGRSVSGIPDKYWIGLTDFLDERETYRSGWRWTDGAVEPASSALSWSGEEPNSLSEDCVIPCENTGRLCSVSCRLAFVPMCQPCPTTNTDVFHRMFEQIVIPYGLSEAEFSENDGCFRLLVDVTSKLECARFCSIEQPGWCVSFYFNQKKKECLLVLYTDAKINVDSPGDWRKFVAKK